MFEQCVLRFFALLCFKNVKVELTSKRFSRSKIFFFKVRKKLVRNNQWVENNEILKWQMNKMLCDLAGRCGLVDRALHSRVKICGSNPSHVFCVAFFLLLLHFLQRGSIQVVVCTVWSLYKVQDYHGIHSQPWNKSYSDKCVTARGDP